MTTALRSRTSRIDARTQALSCAASGVLGVVAGALTLGWPPAVDDDAWSYPFPYGVGLALGIALAVIHVMTAAGFVAVRSLRRGRAVAAGSVVALAGFALLAGGEIAGGVIGRYSTDSGPADVVGAVFGVASLLVAGGSIAAGAALVRGPARQLRVVGGLVLLSGVLLVVLVTPANVSGELAFRMAALMCWSAMFVALGLVLHRQAAAPARGRAGRPASVEV